jgi:MFS transporter, ACS family, D-galactonate transporter
MPDPFGTPAPMLDSERPTGVRWRILALLMCYAAMVHFNRISISVAGTEHIMRDYSLSETQMGVVYSSYLFLYTLCMIPGGWLIDRIGPKRALMFLGFGSAILVPATGLSKFATPATILVVLCVIRALLGIVSAPIHPGAARTASFWFPAKMHGTANGLVTAGAVTGIAATYYVFGWLMERLQWPGAFFAAGAVTFLLTLLWSFYATSRPLQHSGVNDSERRLIEDETAGSDHSGLVEGSAEPGPSLEEQFRPKEDEVLRHFRSLILLTVGYAAYSYFQYLFFYWMQYYFDEVLKLETDVSRLYATLPLVAMALGMISGGWLADQLELRFRSRRARIIAPIFGMTMSALLLVVGIVQTDPDLVVCFFSLSLGALGISESEFWVTGIELGQSRGGFSAAFLNCGGNVGGILAPVITPLFSEQFGWRAGLILASVICFSGSILWFWIRFPRSRSMRYRTN